MTYLIISYVYFSILLLSILFSFLVHFGKNVPSYLKYFTPFLLLTFAVELTGAIIHRKSLNTSPLYNFFSTIEFVFYFGILFQIIRNRIVKKSIVFSIVLYPLIAFTNIIFLQGPYRFHTYTYSIGVFLIVGFCAFYFNEMMKLPVFPNLRREPSFWIIFALFFYYGASLPVWAVNNLMYDLSYDTLSYLGILLLSLNYILYSLFTFAFLCGIKVRKTTS